MNIGIGVSFHEGQDDGIAGSRAQEVGSLIEAGNITPESLQDLCGQGSILTREHDKEPAIYYLYSDQSLLLLFYGEYQATAAAMMTKTAHVNAMEAHSAELQSLDALWS